MLSALFTVFVVAGLGVGAYWYFIGQYRVTTDDAYVQGNVVQVTPLFTIKFKITVAKKVNLGIFENCLS